MSDSLRYGLTLDHLGVRIELNDLRSDCVASPRFGAANQAATPETALAGTGAGRCSFVIREYRARGLVLNRRVTGETRRREGVEVARTTQRTHWYAQQQASTRGSRTSVSILYDSVRW